MDGGRTGGAHAATACWGSLLLFLRAIVALREPWGSPFERDCPQQMSHYNSSSNLTGGRGGGAPPLPSLSCLSEEDLSIRQEWLDIYTRSIFIFLCIYLSVSLCVDAGPPSASCAVPACFEVLSNAGGGRGVREEERERRPLRFAWYASHFRLL